MRSKVLTAAIVAAGFATSGLTPAQAATTVRNVGLHVGAPGELSTCQVYFTEQPTMSSVAVNATAMTSCSVLTGTVRVDLEVCMEGTPLTGGSGYRRCVRRTYGFDDGHLGPSGHAAGISCYGLASYRATASAWVTQDGFSYQIQDESLPMVLAPMNACSKADEPGPPSH